MSGTVFLVRHGRTALNAQGRFRGRLDVPLDEHGLRQASEAARRLARVRVEAVYASPLLRTVQTARAVCDACGVDVVTLEDLIDLDHGAWEGLTPEEAERRDPDDYRRFRRDPRSAAAPGGETMAEVEGRVLSALRSIAGRHRAETAVAVAHEIPIRLAIAALSGIGGSAFWDIRVPTGSVTRLRNESGSLGLEDDVAVSEPP